MSDSIKIAFVFGTRPEVIKLWPLIDRLKKNESFECLILFTGQHGVVASTLFDLLSIVPDYARDFDSCRTDSMTEFLGPCLKWLQDVLHKKRPDYVLVQGDTISTFCGALAGFYSSVKVIHLEAGLRSFNSFFPFPEEMHRRAISAMASLHFAPTKFDFDNLVREGVDPKTIFLTGNTVVDALGQMQQRQREWNIAKIWTRSPFNSLGRSFVLVTMHRRENWGEGIASVLGGINDLTDLYPSVRFLLCMHPNPEIQKMVFKLCQSNANIIAIESQDYPTFIHLMDQALLVMSDSGGVQEEAPSLGTPLLILRTETERVDVLKMEGVRLVGTDSKNIINGFKELIGFKTESSPVRQFSNPFGDGRASEYIERLLLDLQRR